MIPNSIVQHRAKHFDILLARKLSLIEREHLQTLLTHQKLENSIRQANNQSSSNNRTKISIPFDDIYNEQTRSIIYPPIHQNNNDNNSNQKRRLSLSASSSNISRNQTFIEQSDEFSDDTSSYTSFRRRRFCTKSQRLPPIIKSNISNQQKRENRNHYWMANFRQSNIPKENIKKPVTKLNEDISKPNLSELSPIQRQVRSFLETLPTYKEVQHGFDSFGPASLYTNRASIVIR